VKRHNHVRQPPNDVGIRRDFDAWVEEHYSYDADDGAISHVQTVLGTGDPAGTGGDTDNTRPVFEYGIERTPLGDIASRTYPRCSHKYCTDLTQQDRTVTQSFNHGFLTGISDFAPSIQYHPSGMVSQVEHANGVRWSQAADPTGMARPYRIRTHGASDDLNTGIIEYDGAGNIVRTGADRYLYDQVSRVATAELGKYPVSCAKSRTVLGGDDTVASYDSCGTMDVGPYTIGSSGKVTLRAEGTIAFHDGFSVEAGGTLAAESGAVVDLSPAGPTQRTQSYQYDRFGNLTFVTTDGIGQSLDTDAATNHKTGQDIVYDTSGNLAAQPITMGEAWLYKYDPFNMLWDVTRPEGGGWINVYGPGDERTWVIDWTGGSDVANWKETYTLRGLDGAPLRQYAVEGGNASGHWSLTRDYIWRGNTLLAAVRDPGTINETTVYFHPDHLGSPRILTDAAGDTIETHVYFPFGQEAYVNPGDGDVLQFTGHERDDYAAGDTVDLDYMHARYFSAHLGRFMSVDSLNRYQAQKDPQLWNRYTYVQGNPLKYVDPDGRLLIPATGQFSENELKNLALIATSPLGREALGTVISSGVPVVFDSTDAPDSIVKHLMSLRLQSLDPDAVAGETFPPRTIIQPDGSPFYPLINMNVFSNLVTRFHADQSGLTTTAHELGHAARLLGGATIAEEALRDRNGFAASFGRQVHESVVLALEAFYRKRIEQQLKDQFAQIGIGILRAIAE